MDGLLRWIQLLLPQHNITNISTEALRDKWVHIVFLCHLWKQLKKSFGRWEKKTKNFASIISQVFFFSWVKTGDLFSYFCRNHFSELCFFSICNRFVLINVLNMTICCKLHILITFLLAICAQIVTKCEKWDLSCLSLSLMPTQTCGGFRLIFFFFSDSSKGCDFMRILKCLVSVPLSAPLTESNSS